MRAVLLIGLILLAVSAPPLVLMAREVAIGSAVRDRYSVDRIVSSEKGQAAGALRAEIGGHVVELLDDLPIVPDEPDRRERGLVRILVDGHLTSTPVTAIIRLNSRDANRYWGYVYLQRLADREGPERLVVAQNLGQGQYRTVTLSAAGQIVEDTFSYAQRCSPPVRALLIDYVVGHPSGFCSDLMGVWPSVIYPILYPWFSGTAGLLCTVFGATLWFRRHVRATQIP